MQIPNGAQAEPFKAPMAFPQTEISRFPRLGLDIGSTTLKAVLVDGDGNILFSRYERHLSHIQGSLAKTLAEIVAAFPDGAALVTLTGSGALLLSEHLGLPFVQEVIAASTAVRQVIPEADVAIELGGEDAKLTFLSGGIDQRMNETCAGGTGAFIDQMATLLKTDASGLNELAKTHQALYPIASRCGVFAKTDVVALLNEGASRNDIAASIFQAVVDQTIGGLACGRAITGRVAFLGGPLNFLSELRQRFIETLKLTPENIIFPERAEQFVALGAALSARGHETARFSDLLARLKALDQNQLNEHSDSMPRLFSSQEEYGAFLARHEIPAAPEDLSQAAGPLYLGLDMGSTTVKAVLLDQDANALATRYMWGRGDALGAARTVVLDILRGLPAGAFIRQCAVTGYGAAMLRAALGFDIEEVETMAHFKAANHVLPGVSFILDIGGQDIKCMQVKKGNIQRIFLNEACSAGCGAFIETFAESLGFTVQNFTKAALWSESPLDLGSRCTVFMNSKVRCAQKEGVAVEDIAAGLAYAVARNALYKVICIRNAEDLGDKVVVQGGAFINNALLRAFEVILGREVVRPPLPGLMGAFGAALIARERAGDDVDASSALLSLAELEAFTSQTHTRRCMLCGNRCLLTVSDFSGGNKFVSGNKCPKGAGQAEQLSAPNLFAERYDKIFNYTPRRPENAPRGEIGIPRVLNMYENYPLWFTIFTELGYSVQLSSKSSRKLFESGLASIPSQTVCYPAKLVHGHVLDLAKRGIKRIFYPCIPNEGQTGDDADNNFNCPIVCGYPQTVDLNLDELNSLGVEMIAPFLPLDNPRRLAARLAEELGLPLSEVKRAVSKGFKEINRLREEMSARAEEVLTAVEAAGGTAIILAGRPYHLDPKIHHTIPDRIAQTGVAVLTVDDVMHLARPLRGLRVVNQWTYHSRLYRAAAVVAERPYCELIQLTSFGCGLDAITSEQVEEVLDAKGRVYTLIKVDEGSSLGAARLRVSSLLALIDERRRKEAVAAKIGRSARPERLARGHEHLTHAAMETIFPEANLQDTDQYLASCVPVFTGEMRETHTILAPQLSPIHFQFIASVMESEGYNMAILPDVDAETIEIGLKYVNNDLCYPAIITIGQLVQALTSGKYDLSRTALVMSQTGGVCRATNYISCLRKAVADAGFEHIPILSFNMEGFADNPGFKLTGSMLRRMAYGGVYGDLLQRLTCRARPYELTPGAVNALAEHWAAKFQDVLKNGGRGAFTRAVRDTVADFEHIPLGHMGKPRVGIVGEILLKYHPAANNQVIASIESLGGEVAPTDIMDFFLYCAYGDIAAREMLHGSWSRATVARTVIAYVEWLRDDVRKALARSTRYAPPGRFTHLAEHGRKLGNLGQCAGEGWLLTAEMAEFLESDVPNILCVQPFGCLPNHIIGRGMFKEIKRRYPHANLAAIDYDPGASQGNQINRLRLLMAVALEKTLSGPCRMLR